VGARGGWRGRKEKERSRERVNLFHKSDLLMMSFIKKKAKAYHDGGSKQIAI